MFCELASIEILRIQNNHISGSLPVLEWNGEVLAQSITIARFIAREVGLAGRNNLECAQADEAVDALTDLMNAMGQAFFSKVGLEHLVSEIIS